MTGPIAQAVKDRLGIDAPTLREQISEGELGEHREELQDMMDGGGCCNAAMAAEATRRDGSDYR